jgi:hypothetical protein
MPVRAIVPTTYFASAAPGLGVAAGCVALHFESGQEDFAFVLDADAATKLATGLSTAAKEAADKQWVFLRDRRTPDA